MLSQRDKHGLMVRTEQLDEDEKVNTYLILSLMMIIRIIRVVGMQQLDEDEKVKMRR